jgi:AraC-like DNA-binding protein
MNGSQTSLPAHQRFQENFFRSLQGMQFKGLLEALPDLEFFIKDKEGRFVAASNATRQRLGIQAEEDIVGRLDVDVHPAPASSTIRRDDLQVMRAGVPLVDRLESMAASTQRKSWHLTTRLPLFSNDGQVVGIMGLVRPLNQDCREPHLPGPIREVLLYVEQHYRERINVRELARMAHVSARHLNRKLQETMRVSAKEYITRTRIRAACKQLLGTNTSIQDIALDSGFYDQSSFTRMFRKHTGTTPRLYRRRQRGVRSGGEVVRLGASKNA